MSRCRLEKRAGLTRALGYREICRIDSFSVSKQDSNIDKRNAQN